MKEFEFTNKYFNDIDEGYGNRRKKAIIFGVGFILLILISCFIITNEEFMSWGYLLLVFGVVGFVSCIIALFPIPKKFLDYEEYFKQLDINELKKIDDELNREDVFYLKDISMLLTDSYIIQIYLRTSLNKVREKCSHVIKYDDIAWMSFTKEIDPDLMISYVYVELMTKDKYFTDFEAGALYQWFSEEIANTIKEKVLSKNPDIILGHSPKAIEEVKNKYDIDL